ncbi:MAG: redoxin domain-containing protein [Bacteroidota bacterium]
MKKLIVCTLALFAVILANAQYTVYVFLGENCPICQYHTLTLNTLSTEYTGKGVTVVGLFPNPDSDSATIDSFRREYQLTFELRKDIGRQYMNRLGATITPQVFVVDETTGIVHYKGRIDDKYTTLGKRKTTPVVPDLKNALDALLAGKTIPVTETTAIGCYIDSEY